MMTSFKFIETLVEFLWCCKHSNSNPNPNPNPKLAKGLYETYKKNILFPMKKSIKYTRISLAVPKTKMRNGLFPKNMTIGKKRKLRHFIRNFYNFIIFDIIFSQRITGMSRKKLQYFLNSVHRNRFFDHDINTCF